jgi:hypothetical protein
VIGHQPLELLAGVFASAIEVVQVRLLSGIDGDLVRDIETGCDKLALQICTPVDWAACLESCRAEGRNWLSSSALGER